MPAEAAISPRPAPFTGLDPRRILVGGTLIVAVFMLATALDLGGLQVAWENAHWTAAGATAFLFAALTAYRSTGQDRRVAWLVALGTASWLIGELLWVAQTAVGYFKVPAPSDIGFLLLVPPIVAAFVIALEDRLPKAEEVAVYLDAAAIFLAITGLLLDVLRTRHRRRRLGPGRGDRDRLPGRAPRRRGRRARGPPRGPGLAAGRRLRPARRLRHPRLRLGRVAASGHRDPACLGDAAQLRVLGRDHRGRRRGGCLAHRGGDESPVHIGRSGGRRRSAARGPARERAPAGRAPARVQRDRPDRAVRPHRHRPHRRAPIVPRERARAPARRFARRPQRPRDRAPAAGRGGYALPDAGRAGAGRGLHRRLRCLGQRRRPSRLPEPADRGDPRLCPVGLRPRPRTVAEPDPPRGSQPGGGGPQRALGVGPAAPRRLPDDRGRRLDRVGPRRGVCHPRRVDRPEADVAGHPRRHDRAEAPRGAVAPRRPPRPAHRSGEPGAVPRAPGPDARAVAPAADRGRGVVPRHRRLQGRQRLARTRRR